MREIRSAKCGMRSVDCGVEKAVKIALLANYTKPQNTIAMGFDHYRLKSSGQVDIWKSKHFSWSKNGKFIAEICAYNV